MDSSHIVVFMTSPSEEKSATIGRALVEEGLVACCNIVPRIRSIYKWKGELFDEGEALCVMKTRKDRFEELKARVIELHPYEVPELISLGIADGLPDYLGWIDELTRKSD